jgi:putative acetyltransferase
MKIRNYRAPDYIEIADLFHGAVHGISNDIYSAPALEAWAPSPPNYDFWKSRLASTKPFISVNKGIIVGFIELNNNGHIDCLYVHKNHQGTGIASALLEYAVKEATNRKAQVLTVEASKVAMPFFKKRGFLLESHHSVNRRGQALINYKMSLTIKHLH